MKKLLGIALLSFSLFSCNQTVRPKLSIGLQAMEDSIKRADSINIVNQNEVIGDIAFGISEKEFKRLSEKFKIKCDTLGNSQKGSALKKYFIGGYSFDDIYGNFNNDSLYSVLIEGSYISYDNYDDIAKKQAEYLFNVIEHKYGYPKEIKRFPQTYELNNGDNQYCAWQIGKKFIFILINSNSTFFRIKLYFIDELAFNRKKSKEDQREKNLSKKATEYFN